MLQSSKQGAEIFLLWNKIDSPICTQIVIAICLEVAKCVFPLSLEIVTQGTTEGKTLSLWWPLCISRIVTAWVSWEAASGCELDEVVVWVPPAAVSPQPFCWLCPVALQGAYPELFSLIQRVLLLDMPGNVCPSHGDPIGLWNPGMRPQWLIWNTVKKHEKRDRGVVLAMALQQPQTHILGPQCPWREHWLRMAHCDVT